MSRREELLARLQKADGLEYLLDLVATSTASKDTWLRRFAAVVDFDKPLFESVLVSPGPDGATATPPTFDELVKWPEIEPVPRSERRFRVRNRTAVLESWSSGPARKALAAAKTPAPLRDLHQQLADYFTRQGTAAAPRALYHLAAFDPDQAAAVFTALYDAADAAFDLPRCHEILAALNEQYATLPTDLKKLIADRRTYLQARSYWRDEYHRSAFYLERKELTKQFDNFLKGKEWLANLYADGGTGKTAALRWLIARRLVPAPLRIPVTKIDFDFVDALTAISNPAMLIDKMAEELDKQIDGAPFSRLRVELADYTGRFAHSAAAIAGFSHSKLLEFATKLKDVRGSLPTLLIFDTVEVAIVHECVDFNPLIELLKTIHGEAPAVRVILSGRYDLRDRLASSFHRLKKDIVDIRIERLEVKESTDYLVQKRSISRDLATAVVRKCTDESNRCLPFKLTLFGDILNTEKLTAEEIEGYEQVEVVHLIERVIKRLGRRPDEERDRELERLQWVVRYGVVPRRLTFSFLKDVMAGLLAQPMSQAVDYDDPNTGLPTRVHGTVFPQDLLAPGETLDINALWQSLERFAGDRSWVYRDRSQPETLVFHNEVVNPMRRLIEGEPVFRDLHERAVRYYDEEAEKNSARWPAMVREGIYHRFQLGASDAEEHWRAAVSRAGTLSPETIRQIAREITSADYIKDGRPLLRKDGVTPIVRTELAAEAFIIEAETFVQQARRTAESRDLWREAGIAASAAFNLLSGSDEKELRKRLALVRAAVALAVGDADTAAQHIASIGPTEGREALSLQLLQAQIADLKSLTLDAARRFFNARELARSFGAFATRPESPVAREEMAWIESSITDGIVRNSLELGLFEGAIDHLAMVAAGAAKNDPAGRLEVLFRLADVFIEGGLAGTAAMILDGSGERFQNLVRIELVRGEARLARHAPLEALQSCAIINDQLERGASTIAPGQMLVARAQTQELRARALACLAKVQESRLAFEQAIELWKESGDVEALGRCMRTAVAIELRQFEGGASVAHEFLAQLRRSSVTGSRRAAWRTMLLMWEANRDSIGSDMLGAPRTAVESVSFCVAGLRFGDEDQRRDASAALVQALSLIEPAPMRAPLVALLAHAEPLELQKELFETLRRVLPPPDDGETWNGVADEDRICCAIYTADAYRTFGGLVEARNVLAAARVAIDVKKHPLLAIEIDRASRRVGVVKERLVSDVTLLEKGYRNSPELIARWAVELARTSPDTTAYLLRWARAVGGGAADVLDAAKTLVLRALAAGGDAISSGETAQIVSVNVTWKGVGWTPRRGPSFTLPRKDPWTDLGFESSRDGEIVPWEAAKLFSKSPSKAGERLARYLFEIGANAPLPAGPLEIRFSTNESAWHALPWELALNAVEEWRLANVQSFYRTHLGVSGEATVPVERVLVVRPSVESEQREQLGSLQHGLPIDYFYHNADFPAVEVVDPSYGMLERTLFGFRPQLIHICATFVESASRGGVYTHFGGSAPELHAGYFAKLLASFGHPCFIVLDVPAAGGTTDTIRQLMLRNVFAAEFFALGGAAGVLATGLFPPWAQDYAYMTIARSIRAGVTARELLAAVRTELGSVSTGKFSDEISSRGIALFASAGELKFVKEGAG